jgi:hypothetical protein
VTTRTRTALEALGLMAALVAVSFALLAAWPTR